MGEREPTALYDGGHYFEGPRWHDGRTLLLCSAPDFAEEARKAAREAVLFTTRVEVGA
jgi:hypothetical protein